MSKTLNKTNELMKLLVPLLYLLMACEKNMNAKRDNSLDIEN